MIFLIYDEAANPIRDCEMLDVANSLIDLAIQDPDNTYTMRFSNIAFFTVIRGQLALKNKIKPTQVKILNSLTNKEEFLSLGFGYKLQLPDPQMDALYHLVDWKENVLK